MLRGINRQDIFEDDGDYRQMTGCLRSRLTEQYDEMSNGSAWFTLSGTRLSAQPTKPGLYIHGGRKVVIK